MIEATNLTYTYPATEHPVLHGIHFQIKKGEIFGLLGPSGAGKSTAQQILIGKLKTYSGSVRVLGQEVRSVNAAHKKVETFSKGMKMRLNYCRSVLNNPEVLFLDEPTSGLDPVHADNLKQLIEARREAGATIVITTHNMQAAEQLCDRVAFMMNGQILFIDSPRKHPYRRRGEKDAMRLTRLVWFDVCYQWRHRYYLVYLIVCSVYVGILHAIPESYMAPSLVLLTFSDPSALGLLLEGLALTKFISLSVLVALCSNLAAAPWHWLGSWFPAYWPFQLYLSLGHTESIQAAHLVQFLIGLAFHCILIYAGLRRFSRQI